MITEYYRPKSLDEAIQLLSKPGSRPLGGGTFLNLPSDEPIIAIDLQTLELDKIHKVGEKLEIGAMLTLQSLLESIHTPKTLKIAIKQEATLNLRNMGTIAGALVACDGRSSFLTAMLALDPKLILYPSQETVSLGDLLPLRNEQLRGKLIIRIDIPINLQLSYEYIARTPKDKPIICIALARWPSGRTRMVLGGWAKTPVLALDGRVSENDEISALELAASNTASDGSDEWASAEYRREMAKVLARRCWNNSLAS